MLIPKNPYIRVPLAIAVVIMLYFMPTREFLKITFMLGVPFIFLLGYMVKQPRASLGYKLCALGLLLVLGLYVYELVRLPDRIEERIIIRNGAALVAEGRYDEAIDNYRQLAELGKIGTMEEKIATAELEKEAEQQLARARELIAAGDIEAARQIIEALPAKSRAAWESRDLLKSLE